MKYVVIIPCFILLGFCNADAQVPKYTTATVTDSVSHAVLWSLLRFKDRFNVGDYLSILGNVDMIYGAAYAPNDSILDGFAFRLDEVGKAYLRDFLARRADTTEIVRMWQPHISFVRQ